MTGNREDKGKGGVGGWRGEEWEGRRWREGEDRKEPGD